MILAEEYLHDQFREDDARAATAIERREPRNNRYIAILERELHQQRELAAAWRGLALTCCACLVVTGALLWSKW